MFYMIILGIIATPTIIYANLKIIKHTVKKGETLQTIAKKNNTTAKEIKRVNDLEKEDLKPGKILFVPSDKKETRVMTMGICKKDKGNTFFSFAKDKKSYTLAELIEQSNAHYDKKDLNDNIEPSLLPVPMFLKCTKPEVLASKGVLGKLSEKKKQNIISLVKSKLGRAYVWGAAGENNTFDCSGLTVYAYKKNGVTLPRRAIWQSKVGKYIRFEGLKKGDLVFFDTSKERKGFINHVGIYIGDDKFLHASSASKKVVITKFGTSFYRRRFKWGRRL